jgi:hypothetical protein
MLTALAGALAAPLAALAAAPNLLRILATPIARAEAHRIPVLLPATIDARAPHLYGAGGASAKGYDIQLSSAPDCNDANACFVAEFTAGSGKPISGTAVALAGRRTGHYVASACGASCNPATIQWQEYGRNYAIEYIGTRRQMTALADAAIDAGPR